MRPSIRFWLIITVPVMLAGITACGAGQITQRRDNDVDTVQLGGTPSVDGGGDESTRIGRAINDFAFDLLRHTSGSSGPNTVISPYSVASIIALTSCGARGATGAEMRQVLHVDDMTVAAIEEHWAELNNDLAKRSPDQKLSVANAGWARKGLRLRPEFVASARDAFGAEITTVDFASQDVASLVNHWVAAQTDSLITKIVEHVNSTAVLLLANAVYFKGLWERPFRVGGTFDGDFELPDGTIVKVPIMSRGDNSIRAYETSSFVMVRLPYKGSDSSMYLILPDQKMGLSKLEETMNGEQFLAAARTTAELPPRKNTVLGLPRLDLSWGQENMVDILRAMGISSAFDPGAADLGGIADPGPMWISQLAHATRVKVGELGTEAAAATFEMALRGVPSHIVFNRPFLFAIVDEQSGVILFLGGVTDPRAN